MKALVLIVSAAVVAALGWWQASSEDGKHEKKVTTETHASHTSHVSHSPAEVFQKAFWQHPSANDKILHAERQEWSEKGEIKRWRWFITVQPSPELLKRLRADNVFRLQPVKTSPLIADAPEWFIQENGQNEILQTPDHSMTVFFDRVTGLLQATDSGTGFNPGAERASKLAVRLFK